MAFLELTETATAAEIKTRIAEKLAYYETQSEKASSDFLRRLNLRNLGKVKAILKDSTPWISLTLDPEPAAQENRAEETAEEPAQTVYIVSSLKEAAIKRAESKEIKKKRSPGEPAGWLIRHTENQAAKTYPVHTGKNFVGRKQQASMEPFIVIEGDDFISRVQCVIYAEEGDADEFYISDPSAFNNGKTSKNGTYINGNPVAVTEKIKLAEGDTIQVGITKFVIRCNTADIEKIVQEVEESKYTETVVLDT